MTHNQPALQMAGVGVRRGEFEILRSVDWTLPSGESCAVLGPNGCGKTTLMNIITAFIWPTVGTVDVLGCRLGRVDVRRLRQRIAVVDPHARMGVDPRHSALQTVLTGYFATLFLYDRPDQTQQKRAVELLKVVGLDKHQDQRFELLSTGEQRRCLLARALVRVPSLLILDEPTAGLDIAARERLLATLYRLHRQHPRMTVITVTHHVEELSPDTGQVLVLSDGEVAALGPPEQAITSERLSRVYGCQVSVQNRSGRWWLEVSPEAWGQLLDGSAEEMGLGKK